MNERVLGLAQSSSYSDLPSSVAASGKVVFAPDKSSRLVFEPYFSWYYGLSGLAMYASYLDPYRTGPTPGISFPSRRCWIRISASPQVQACPGSSPRQECVGSWATFPLSPCTTAGMPRWIPWFFPNNDVRHTFKSTCSFTFNNTNQLSASLNLFMDKPFTPEQVADAANGTLVKESFNSARDLVPRFTLGLKWETNSKFFGLPGALRDRL